MKKIAAASRERKSAQANKAGSASRARPRRKLVPISQEMRHWAALLESELDTFPGIKTKSMFGFQAYYRGGEIFAAIPRTRGYGTPNSLMVKFFPVPDKLIAKAKNDSRLSAPTGVPGNGWHAFELSSSDDIRHALWWLREAHSFAGK
jgi:hypothetical protein